MSWKGTSVDTGEPFLWAGHLKYSVPYCGWYQSALYKCYPLLDITSLENHAKIGECLLLFLYYFGQNTCTSKDQRTLLNKK